MSLRRIADGVSLWLDLVAVTVIALIGRLRSARRVQLVEEEDGTFSVRIPGQDADPAGRSVRLLAGGDGVAPPAGLAAVVRGSRAELVLRPDHFLFRPLELPKRAAEFLAGIVRAQIDRLTPWSAGDAAFGWTQPIDAPNDRIALTVVATARARITPYVETLTRLGADSIVVSSPAADAAPIMVFEQCTRGVLDVARVRRALLVVLAVAAVTAGLAVSAAQIVGDDLEARERDLARRIGERRVAMRAGRDAASAGTAAQRMLERRKHESAASVMVLEALSQVLPDHTYVTELRIEGDKLQVIGITRDAPSLIRLIEQSPHFTRATFFAPTTRSPGDPGERFHVEAQIKPVFMSGT